MLLTCEDPEVVLNRIDAAIVEFEGRPDQSRRSALLEALYRRRDALTRTRKAVPAHD
jgi:hypothetical protein